MFSFGQSTATPQQTTPSFSFGASQQQQQQQPQQQQPSAPTFSFGASQQQQPGQQAQHQQQQQPSFSFSGSTFGQPQQQQSQPQQQQQQQQQQVTSIDRHTRVSDLPQDAQNLIEQLDKHITSQKSLSDQLGLSQEAGQQQADSVQLDVQEMTRRYGQLTAALASDSTTLERLRDLVRQDAEHGQLSTRFVDGLRNGTLNLRGTADPVLQYFFETTDKAELDMRGYARLILEVEAHVRQLKQQGAPVDAALLMASVREQQEAFLRLAEVVADLHDRCRR